jgi:hypothetical protein
VDTDAIRLNLPEENALAAKIAEKSITLLSNNIYPSLSKDIKR